MPSTVQTTRAPFPVRAPRAVLLAAATLALGASVLASRLSVKADPARPFLAPPAQPIYRGYLASRSQGVTHESRQVFDVRELPHPQNLLKPEPDSAQRPLIGRLGLYLQDRWATRRLVAPAAAWRQGGQVAIGRSATGGPADRAHSWRQIGHGAGPSCCNVAS